MVVMARLVPHPQALIDQLLRLIIHPTPREPTGSTTDERILDAALTAFTAHGIRATTMSQIARDAKISREWLYKHFPNRNAIVLEVTRREAVRLIDGLVVHVAEMDDLDQAATEAFVFAIEFLRDHPLLQRVLTSETDALGPSIVEAAAPVVGVAVQTTAGYLQALGDLRAEDATVAAETIVRLAASIALAPRGTLDLHDPVQLRRYAGAAIPAILTVRTPQVGKATKTARRAS
jgi:AcrR family transcriptional regulator